MSKFAGIMRIQEAQDLFFSKVNNIERTELVDVEECCDRILAQTVIANRDLPGFRRSAMDGYAVIAEDTYGASDSNPHLLRIIGKVKIGNTSDILVKKGTAVRIPTGAPVPEGATAVIKVEDCLEIADQVEIHTSVTNGKNIAEKDEDVRKDEEILTLGRPLRPWDIALLLAEGIYEIEVYSNPRVAIISTGDELVDVKTSAGVGQVVDSNRPALESWMRSLGVEIVHSTMERDNIDHLKQMLQHISCDLIVTTGGTSMGEHDYMERIIAGIGQVLVKGVATRPGKPVILGLLNKTPIVALPGYPLAAFFNFHYFVVPILQQWNGKTSYWEKRAIVTLNHGIASKAGIRDIARLQKEKNGVKLIRITGSGILSSLTKADYLLEIPEDIEGYAEGTQVEVIEVWK